MTARKRTTRRSATKKYWSRNVTEHSHALDLEPRVFTRSPAEIARSLKRSAERSRHRKTSPYRSAMSMLTFFENRAGKSLSPTRKRKLERAKLELKGLFGRPRSSDASSHDPKKPKNTRTRVRVR